MTWFNYSLWSVRLCFARHDWRSQAEARAKALILKDYQKLGPLKWGSAAGLQILMQMMHNEYICVSFQFRRGRHFFLFCSVCCSSVLKRSKVCSRLVSVFQKGVRNGPWLSYVASLLCTWALKTSLRDDCWDLFLFVAGTCQTQSLVWSSCPFCSSSLLRNLLWNGGLTQKVSQTTDF